MVDTQIALLRNVPDVIALKNRGAVRAFFITIAAAGAFIGVNQYCPIFRLLADGGCRTGFDADRLFAVVSGYPLEMDADRGESLC
jgi:hypothetical protein